MLHVPQVRCHAGPDLGILQLPPSPHGPGLGRGRGRPHAWGRTVRQSAFNAIFEHPAGRWISPGVGISATYLAKGETHLLKQVCLASFFFLFLSLSGRASECVPPPTILSTNTTNTTTTTTHSQSLWAGDDSLLSSARQGSRTAKEE